MDWRIYYGDGSTYSDEDGPPEAAPPWGAVAVVTRDPNDPREITSVHGTGFDYFVYDGAGWWGVDFVGLIDRLATRTAQVVCFGRTIRTADFESVIARSVKDGLD